MEAEAIDSVSKERVAAVVVSESGSRVLGYTAGLTSLGQAKEVMDGWAKRFVARIDKLHGYAK